jgi:hypothetical protein
VIILDESRLTNGTLLMIAQDYEMLEDPIDIENYDRNVEAVVNRFKFDLDEFKKKLVNIIKDNLKVELKLKS